MLPFFSRDFANPSSSQHHSGREASRAVDIAREHVAEALGADPAELLFTSGATESNNVAILGIARHSGLARKKLFVSAIEHSCVVNSSRSLRRSGYDVITIPVNRRGTVDLDWLREKLDDSVLLVSVQAASNEIGTIQPIAEIAALSHGVGATFHCDAAQAFGKITIDVRKCGIDLLSLSAHKVYGPKGVGALYVRGGLRAAPLSPVLFGGGQESGLRPGTLNVPGIVGLGIASRIAAEELQTESLRVQLLRDRLQMALLQASGCTVNGSQEERLPGNLSLTVQSVDAEALIANSPEVVFSSGAACSAGTIDPSPVLLAIGLTRQEAFETIRICVGRYTTDSDIDFAAERLCGAIALVRSMGES
jgi:cysteine desulfurase